MEHEHPPEDVCWVQTADSLAFSVSPVGPSTGNNTRGDDGDDDGDDDDHPLMGEYICDNDDGGGAVGGNPDDDSKAPAPTPAPEDLRYHLFDHDGYSAGRGSPPLPSERAYGDNSGDARVMEDSEKSPLSCESMLGENRSELIGAETPQESPREIDEGSNNNHELVDTENEEPQQFPEPQWDEGDENEGWVDEAEQDLFAPAWDQGRPAEFHCLEGEAQHMRRSASLYEERLPSPQNQPNVATSGSEGGDSDRDTRSCGNYDSVRASRGDREESSSRVVRRRTRLSLERERRRLDRVPRSQRLSQVKGHPLGGMTLLELEERHLLDVALGQDVKRHLAQRRAGCARQADADLLRRSARLLRRAQKERDARYSFQDKREYHGHGASLYSCHGASGAGQQVGVRRPASASRDRCRAKSSSLSLESEESINWVRASKYGPARTDARGYTTEGVPPVGLYSGGGTKCSLKQRRPMSAKPALTCGSGWEPGRTRTRRRRRGQQEFEDTREASIRGVPTARARGLEDMSDGSEMSDLSPHGIVEYTDEEEGPFNVDELERVAASYLLHPRGSVCHSSPAVVEDRFADDGSVYIYREDDGSSQGYEEGRREHNNVGEVSRHSHNRGQLDEDDSMDQECTKASTSARTRENGNVGERSCGGSDGDHWGDFQQRDMCGSRQALGGQACRDTEGRKREAGVQSRTCGSSLTFCGGDVAAGIHQRDRVKTGTASQNHHGPPGIICGRSQAGSGTESQRGVHRQLDTTKRKPETHSNLPTKNGCNSHPDHHGQGDVPPEMLVPVPGANYSPKADKGVHGRGCRRASAGDSEGGAAVHSAKVKQAAVRLREMILDRQASAGRSIRQVFGHFDRRGCGYVNVEEMREALADLRLNLSPSESKELHSSIALDGGDRWSYAEFAVFVSDPYHSELQDTICRQAAGQLEALGRPSFNLHGAFYLKLQKMDTDTDTAAPRVVNGPGMVIPQRPLNDHQTTRDTRVRQLVGAATGRAENNGVAGENQVVFAAQFVAGLKALGLRLSSSDVQRLLVRFDVHGDGYLSTGRFVSMVESSRPWTQALLRLAHQEEADEEADACLRAQRMYGRWPAEQALSIDIVEMARYIGIRVSSDASLLWIAADALAAPLPNAWVTCKGRDGRCFYHNKLTGHSRWDHPLDPHFRRVYLRERFGSTDAEVDHGIDEPYRGAVSDGAVSAAGRGWSGGAHVASAPPVMLPPRRMRPSVLDFPTDGALNNQRTRKLNGSGRGRLAMGTAAKQSAVSTSTSTVRTNRESWTDTRKKTASPTGARRRRPVSASVLREGLEERRLGPETTAPDARPGVVGGCGRSGLGSTSMAVMLYAGEGTGLEETRHGSTARKRRPLSATAALQRPPADRQSNIDRRGERHNKRRELGTTAKRSAQQSRQLSPPRQVDKHWVVQGVSSAAKAISDGTLSNRDNWRSFGDDGYHTHKAGASARRPEGRAVAKKGMLGGETAEGSTSPQEERAWLLDRLVDILNKLGDGEMISRGDRQHSSASRDPRGLSEGRSGGGQGRSRSNGGRVASDALDSDASSGRSSFLQANDTLPKSTGSGLRNQVVELSNRMRDLETRVHDPRPHRDDERYPRSGSSSASPLFEEAAALAPRVSRWEGVTTEANGGRPGRHRVGAEKESSSRKRSCSRSRSGSSSKPPGIVLI